MQTTNVVYANIEDDPAIQEQSAGLAPSMTVSFSGRGTISVNDGKMLTIAMTQFGVVPAEAEEEEEEGEEKKDEAPKEASEPSAEPLSQNEGLGMGESKPLAAWSKMKREVGGEPQT